MTTTNGQYPPKVCKRLDAIAAERDGRVQREHELVNNRKALFGEFAELGPGETSQHKTIALDLVQTLLEIDFQRAKIKELADKLTETVRTAHQEQLFDDEDTVPAKIVPTQQELFEASKPKPKDEQPSEPKEREETPDEEDPGVAEGENQHLAASVSELNMGKDEVDQCVAAGCTTVGALKRVMDSDPTWGELAKKLGLTGQAKPLNAIGRAVKEFCKTHEKAALAKFKGEENGPRVDHRKSRGERIGKGATKTKGKKHARK